MIIATIWKTSRDKNRTEDSLLLQKGQDNYSWFVSDFQVHIVPEFRIIQKEMDIEYLPHTHLIPLL